MTQRGRTTLAAIAATTLALAASACGGSGSGDHGRPVASPAATSGATDAFAPGSKLDLASAKQMLTDGFGDAHTVHMEVRMTGQVRMSGTGDMDLHAQPATGAFTLSSSTLGGGSIRMLMVGDAMYLKSQRFGPKYLKVSTAGKNSAVSRLGLSSLDPTSMLDGLGEEVTGGTYVGKATLDGTQTDHYTFTLGTTSGTAPMQAWFDGEGRYRQIQVTSGGNTVTETFSGWGEPVVVSPPPTRQVKDMTPLLNGELGSK